MKVDIRTDRPTHYGTHGYSGVANSVGWSYADLIIESVAAGTGYLVDVYIKLTVDVPAPISTHYYEENRSYRR